MSLILDALRKMEQDRKNRRGAGGDLRPEVLRYRGNIDPEKAKPYLLAAAGLLLVVVGAGAGFLLRGHGGSEASEVARGSASESRPGETATSPATVVVAPAAPSYPAAAATAAPVTPVATPAAIPSSALSQSAPAPQSAATALPTAAAARPAALHPAREEAASAAVPTSAAKAPSASRAGNLGSSVADSLPATAPSESKKGRKAVAAKSAASPPTRDPQAKRARTEAQEPVQNGAADISISGIAWQEERNMRRAVLNGTLVGEGATVSGARVVEIQENKVRLSRNGRLFDLTLGGGLPR